MESGSKKLFEYHGRWNWVDDVGDYQSLYQIHDHLLYFCTDNIIPYYLLSVTAGKDTDNTVSSPLWSPLVIQLHWARASWCPAW